MLRAALQICFVCVLIIAGTVALHWYTTHDAAQQKLLEAQAQTKKLEEVVQRLTDEKRVAEVIVTDQSIVDGVRHQTLLFVEYARDGSSLTPRSFTIAGEMAHIDAMVLKLDGHCGSGYDPLRGHSSAPFLELYGHHPAPKRTQIADTQCQLL